MTSSYMIAGDSKLERNLGVAPGFPSRILKQDELITTNDIMTVLGVEEGDMISTDFDLLQLLGGQETAKLKQMMFDFESMHTSASQGEAILDFLNMPPDVLFRVNDYFSAADISRIRGNFSGHKTRLAFCIN